MRVFCLLLSLYVPLRLWNMTDPGAKTCTKDSSRISLLIAGYWRYVAAELNVAGEVIENIDKSSSEYPEAKDKAFRMLEGLRERGCTKKKMAEALRRLDKGAHADQVVKVSNCRQISNYIVVRVVVVVMECIRQIRSYIMRKNLRRVDFLKTQTLSQSISTGKFCTIWVLLCPRLMSNSTAIDPPSDDVISWGWADVGNTSLMVWLNY